MQPEGDKGGEVITQPWGSWCHKGNECTETGYTLTKTSARTETQPESHRVITRLTASKQPETQFHTLFNVQLEHHSLNQLQVMLTFHFSELSEA